MDTISFGPFQLTASIIIEAAAAIAGITVHRIWAQRAGLTEAHGSMVTSALLVWILVWKLSGVLLAPRSVISSGLLAIVYLAGGVWGAWLGLLAALVYFIWARNKRAFGWTVMLQSAVVFAGSGYTVYSLLRCIWGDGSSLTNGLLAALGAIVTVLLLYNNPSNQSASKHALQLILLLGIGHALVTTLGAQLWERADKAAAASTVGLKEGQLAPDFELTDVSGQRRKLSELRGQTVVVNFWATWCPPCRAEMPELQAFYMRYKDQGVTILAVNAANTETSEGYVAAWLKERGLSFPVVYDSAGEVTKAYRVSAYPSTIIVGPDGLIRTKKQGPMSSVTLSMATGVR